MRAARRVAVMVSGIVATSCGSEGTGQPTWTLEDLAPEEGFQLKFPSLDVPAGHEEQSCYFVKVPDLDQGRDFMVDRVLMATTTGTHHLNIFRVRTVVELGPDSGESVQIGAYAGTVVYGHDDYRNNPCWISSNWSDWPLVANTESPLGKGPYTDWKLPDQVAMRFSPGETLMIQPHYVNTRIQPTPIDARIGINFYRGHQSDVMELGTLFATQQNIRICSSHPTPAFSGACRLPHAATITAANGHFHSRGREFSMFVWDGRSITQPPDSDRFYQSFSWSSPPMATDLDKAVEDGGGIWWNCSYEWTAPASGCAAVNAKDPQQEGDCCYVFGGNTDVGEHCNGFVYYYPKLTTDVFCN